MVRRRQFHQRLSVRFAHAITKGFAWGLPDVERQSVLAESLADWEAMRTDRPAGAVVARAVQGIPASVLYRLDARRTTALPAGAALTMLSLAAVAGAYFDSAYHAPLRISLVALALGVLMVGYRFVRSPLALAIERFRLAAAMIGLGSIGMALNLPTADRWIYESPVIDNPAFDKTIAATLIAFGLALLLFAAVIGSRPSQRAVATIGWLAMGAMVAFALTQLVWGIVVSPVDVAMAGPSLIGGLAILSLAHVIPRLRHLIEPPQDTLR